VVFALCEESTALQIFNGKSATRWIGFSREIKKASWVGAATSPIANTSHQTVFQEVSEVQYFTFPPLCQLDVFLEKHPGILAQDRPGRLGSGICMQSTGVDCRDLATCHCSIIKTVQSLHDSRTCLEVYLNQKSFLVAQSTSPHFKSLGISSHLASGIKRGPAGSRRCICILEATLVDIRRAGRRA
jgi:hypothetical protein